MINSIYQPRNRFAHKGNFGHAMMIAGSYGKMGAAVMASKACLHTGVGLLTCHIPKCGYEIMQTSLPEAMTVMDSNGQMVTELPVDIDRYSCIGIGPGIGTSDETQNMVSFIIRRYKKPLVIDADGLNCIAIKPELLTQLPDYSILTPHPKEFDRLFGNHDNDFNRLSTAISKSVDLNKIIVLKGHHTAVALPDGHVYFNNTGNAGMAKGGSGDVLTGIITSFLAQGYQPWQAAVFGVYIHGLSGDLAARDKSQEALTATDIITYLSGAFIQINNAKCKI
jgi:NAD(P)H-hydrate epimerase